MSTGFRASWGGAQLDRHMRRCLPGLAQEALAGAALAPGGDSQAEDGTDGPGPGLRVGDPGNTRRRRELGGTRGGHSGRSSREGGPLGPALRLRMRQFGNTPEFRGAGGHD